MYSPRCRFRRRWNLGDESGAKPNRPSFRRISEEVDEDEQEALAVSLLGWAAQLGLQICMWQIWFSLVYFERHRIWVAGFEFQWEYFLRTAQYLIDECLIDWRWSDISAILWGTSLVVRAAKIIYILSHCIGFHEIYSGLMSVRSKSLLSVTINDSPSSPPTSAPLRCFNEGLPSCLVRVLIPYSDVRWNQKLG